MSLPVLETGEYLEAHAQSCRNVRDIGIATTLSHGIVLEAGGCGSWSHCYRTQSYIEEQDKLQNVANRNLKYI